MIINNKEQSKTINIDPKLIEFSYYKDSGNGGQKRNKTLSGVRIQYKNIILTCCETRSQNKNKEILLNKLQEKLQEQEENKTIENIKNKHSELNPRKGKRGNYNRNYNFPRNEIKQENQTYNLKKFLKGNLKELY